MAFKEILAAMDNEIAQLEKARVLLSDEEVTGAKRVVKKAAAKKEPAQATTSGKRTMSPEGRARIAAAQKKRWAAQKKATK